MREILNEIITCCRPLKSPMQTRFCVPMNQLDMIKDKIWLQPQWQDNRITKQECDLCYTIKLECDLGIS